MSMDSLEGKLQELTGVLVSELISLTPESMDEIQFEIVGTNDGGANVGLIENHSDVKHVALSDTVYSAASQYLPLIKQYVPGWIRTLMVLRLAGDEWNVEINFERE